MSVSETIVALVKIYAGLGGAVSAAFLLWGIDRIDPAARGSYTFRPLLVPGIMLLWPLVLRRWQTLEKLKD